MMDLDSEDVNDVLYGHMNECMMDTVQTDVSVESEEEFNPSNMQRGFM